MGCDIHVWVQIKTTDKWSLFPVAVFSSRSYRVFGWLADVRNYAAIQPLDTPRGWPTNLEDLEERANTDLHSHTWFPLKELLYVDYSQLVENRRVMKDGNGGHTCSEGDGEITTLRQFLGAQYFADLEGLKGLHFNPFNVRILIAFDN